MGDQEEKFSGIMALGDNPEKRSIINVFSDKPIDWPRSIRDVVIGTLVATAFSAAVGNYTFDSSKDAETQSSPDTELVIDQPAEGADDLAL